MDIGQFETRQDEEIKSLKPLWALPNWRSRSVFLPWAYQALFYLERMHENRIRSQQNFLLWYTGEYDPNLEYKIISPDRGVASPIPRYSVPVVINHLYDLTEQRVAMISAFKPAFDVLPNNTEESDRTNARLMKQILDAIARKNQIEFVLSNLERWTAVFGESFLYEEWNPEVGPKEGDKFLGDVELGLKEPFYVLYEPRRDWRKVSFLIEIDEVAHVDEIRKKYHRPSLEPDRSQTLYSFQSDDTEGSKADDEVVVYRCIYKPSPYMPDGLVCRFACKEILTWEADSYPWRHKDFPYERSTDIDVPGRVFPTSSYQMLVPIQHQYNKMTSMVHRSITLGAHFKWFMTKGACDIKALGNNHTVVQVNPGANAPVLQSFNTVPQEVFQYRRDMREELQTLSGTQGVSRGTPPPGVRSNSMLKFYEEQERQRRMTALIKRNELVRTALTKVADLVGQYYPENPQRLIRVVGPENEYDIIKLVGKTFSSEVDIIIQNSTGFSESMAGRMEELDFIMKNLPGVVSPEQAADILGLKSPQKFYDTVTAALAAAEAENQNFLDGVPVQPPAPWEDLVTHWRTHLIFMQNPTFKRLPKRLQDAAIEHVGATEMLMDEMAQKSPAFRQQLMAIPNFPVFWTPEPELPGAVSQEAAQEPPPAPAPSGATAPLSPEAAEPGLADDLPRLPNQPTEEMVI